jgi:hypothetical protein
MGTSTEIILTALRTRASRRHTAAQLVILLEEIGIFFREGGLFVTEAVETLIFFDVNWFSRDASCLRSSPSP